MPKIATAVVLSEADRSKLESWVKAQFTPQQVALRSHILLMAADGKQDLEIAAELSVNRHTPALWRKRFQTQGLDGLWEVHADSDDIGHLFRFISDTIPILSDSCRSEATL